MRSRNGLSWARVGIVLGMFLVFAGDAVAQEPACPSQGATVPCPECARRGATEGLSLAIPLPGVLIEKICAEGCAEPCDAPCESCDDALTPLAQQQAGEILQLMQATGPSVLEGSLFAEPAPTEVGPLGECEYPPTVSNEQVARFLTELCRERLAGEREAWGVDRDCAIEIELVDCEDEPCEETAELECDGECVGHQEESHCEHCRQAKRKHARNQAASDCEHCRKHARQHARRHAHEGPAHAGDGSQAECPFCQAHPDAEQCPWMRHHAHMNPHHHGPHDGPAFGLGGLPFPSGPFVGEAPAGPGPFDMPGGPLLGPGFAEPQPSPWMQTGLAVGVQPAPEDALRESASRVDDAADLLESIGEFEAADALRAQADQLRQKARALLREAGESDKQAESSIEFAPPVADPEDADADQTTNAGRRGFQTRLRQALVEGLKHRRHVDEASR